MKTISTLLAAAAISSVFYLGYSINHSVSSFERRVDSALVQVDRLNQRFDQLPAMARTASEEAVKGAARQVELEIVAAPAEMGKAIVKNTGDTAEKAVDDFANEFARAPENVSEALESALGL